MKALMTLNMHQRTSDMDMFLTITPQRRVQVEGGPIVWYDKLTEQGAICYLYDDEVSKVLFDRNTPITLMEDIA